VASPCVKLAMLTAADALWRRLRNGDLSLAFYRALQAVSMSRASLGRNLILASSASILRSRCCPSHERRQRRAVTPRPSAISAGDAQSLPLADASYNVVSIAFGIRNVADPACACANSSACSARGPRGDPRVFPADNGLLRALYNFYFRRSSRTATLISGDKTGAYRYLPESRQHLHAASAW